MKMRVASAAIIYERVSTEEQARDAYGLESQDRTCRNLCQARGWTVRKVFRDSGVSAWQDVERPAFRQMMQYLRENRDVNLVFYDYSRFGRKTLPALTAFKVLDSLGVYSIAAMNTGIGRTARREELSKAEDFSDQHSEKQKERMRAAWEDGRWCRLAPLGYHNVGTKLRGQPNIVPTQAEADSLPKRLNLYALVKIARQRSSEQ
jgi:site-specific DNA recombinase